MKHRYILAICTLLLGSTLLSSCYSNKPYYRKSETQWDVTPLPTHELAYTMYLIGDAGESPDEKPEPALYALKERLKRAPADASGIVFLGDNLYPRGLHKKKHEMREQDERYLDAQLSVVDGYDGHVYFIPGNHDWKQGGKEGLEFVKRQEKYIEEKLDRKDAFQPSNGCPDPQVVELTDDVVLIMIDTQWMLHRYKRSQGEKDDCECENEVDFANLLRDALKRNRSKKIILAGHHPLYSNGEHGGNFTASTHLFPLHDLGGVGKYIPLPVIGSIYPIYRRFLGDIQDIPHPRYQALKKIIVDAIDANNIEHIAYVCGHEHTLQFHNKDEFDHIVTGAGCKTTYLKRNRQLYYGQSAEGFTIMRYYKNGEVWMEFLVPDDANPLGKVMYRKQLKGPDPQLPATPPPSNARPSYADSTVTIIPSEYYRGGPMKKFFFGSLYRDVWTAPIEVPVLDIHYEKGGLTPLKQGGGMQTRSLRYEGGDGHQYVTRSIEKYARQAIPKALRKTFAANLVQDGIAASHPYGAIVVPPLADAVGVYHTNPKLVIIPTDPVLGEYMDVFGGMLALFEERPHKDMSHQASFGNTEKIVGSPDMIEKLESDYDHQVSPNAMLRARLFDMFLNDWDRHDDQWRWASFKDGKKTIYHPIPRDRDQAFFKQNGLLTWFSNRTWSVRKFQSFKGDIRDIKGMNFNGRYVDRAYLTEPELADWLAVADSMQKELTDQVIEQAIKGYPAAGFELRGEQQIDLLKQRRDKLNEFAERYYKVLSREVNVVGTHKDEFFEIKRLNDDETEVSVFPRKKGKPDRDKRIYHRVFNRKETKEIRIYGLDGNDEYQLKGEAKKGILVRIVGGTEKDKFEDDSNVKGLGKRVLIYDTREKKKKKRNKVEKGPDTGVKIMPKRLAVEYNRTDFHYNFLGPVAYVGFNPDDGVYLGGGVDIKRYGFKKSPWASRHTIKGNYAALTGAFNFDYQFEYPQLFRTWDLVGEAEVNAPEFVFNFYGLGNETPRLSNRQLDYRLRLNYGEFTPMFRLTKGALDNHKLVMGPSVQYINPTNETTNIEDVIPGFILPNRFENRVFGGAKAGYSYWNSDSRTNPHRGVHFVAEAQYLRDFRQNTVEFTKLKGELSLYFPINFAPGKVTLANRTGGASNLGDYEFYQANFLGGYNEFRGLRRNRFGGDATFYNNTDLRIKLFDLKTYIVPFEIGVLGFHDYGRVWLDGENSDKWHQGYGGGLYISPLNAVVITGNYARTTDDEFFVINLGFLF